MDGLNFKKRLLCNFLMFLNIFLTKRIYLFRNERKEKNLQTNNKNDEPIVKKITKRVTIRYHAFNNKEEYSTELLTPFVF